MANEMTQQQQQQKQKELSRQRAMSAVQQIETLLPKFKMVLPPHVQPERFARICITAITQDPKLLECSPKSILEACLTAAQLGLEPNKQIGEGYFIAFNSKDGPQCQWMTGYKGYLTLARNSGEISIIDAQVVYGDDLFEYEYGLEARLKHIPAEGDRLDENITHAWAMVKYKDGAYGFRVLTRAEINKRKKISKTGNYDSSPWKSWFPEMCRKTAIRAIANHLPKSVQKALTLDNASDRGEVARLDFESGGDFAMDLPDEMEAVEAPKIAQNSSRLDGFATEAPAEVVGDEYESMENK